MGQRAFRTGVLGKFGWLVLRLSLGRRDHNGGADEHLDVVRIATKRLGPGADVGDDISHVVTELTVDEDALGVRCGEFAPAYRGPRLIQHGRALRRWLRQVDRVDLVVRALMLHAMNARWISELSRRAVAQHSTVFPAPFPKLVDHLH